MNITAEQSIFLLNQAEREAFNELSDYENYFYLLREPYGTSRFSYALMQDIALYFYIEQTPVYNHQLTLIHPLRHEILANLIGEARFKRMKGFTQNKPVLSLFTAALATNLYIDILQGSFVQIGDEQALQFHHFNDCIEEIFEISFSKQQAYPKKFVQMETKVLQSLRDYLLDQEASYAQQVQKIHRMVDHYVLKTKELYEVELKL